MEHESHGGAAESRGKPSMLLMLSRKSDREKPAEPSEDEGMKAIARDLAAGLGLPGADIARVAKALRAFVRVGIMHESGKEAREKSEGA